MGTFLTNNGGNSFTRNLPEDLLGTTSVAKTEQKDTGGKGEGGGKGGQEHPSVKSTCFVSKSFPCMASACTVLQVVPTSKTLFVVKPLSLLFGTV